MIKLIESENKLKELLSFAFVAGCELVDSQYCEGYNLDYISFDEWFEKHKKSIEY